MSQQPPAEFPAVDRRQSRNVSREEFNAFAASSCEWRKSVTDRLDAGDKILKDLSTAIFAADDKNDNGQVGLMVTARRIEQHIDAVCHIARWLRNSVLAVCGLIVAVAGAAKAMGFY